MLANLFITVVLLMAPAPQASTANSTPDSALTVLSFNLRVWVPSDGPDAWPHRRDGAARIIDSTDAAVVGVQEAQRSMLDDLSSRLPRYRWVGAGRSPDDEATEYSALLYRPERLELLEHDTFWLSETPDRAGSMGWDAAYPRVVTWGRFRDRTSGRILYVFNTHFDHAGQRARAESAHLLRRRIHAIAGEEPVVVTGDFNALPDSEPYHTLTDAAGPAPALRDALHAARRGHTGPTSTWNGFDAIEPGRRIDFIFASNGVEVLHHRILDTRLENGRFPSDHLPVLASVAVPPER